MANVTFSLAIKCKSAIRAHNKAVAVPLAVGAGDVNALRALQVFALFARVIRLKSKKFGLERALAAHCTRLVRIRGRDERPIYYYLHMRHSARHLIARRHLKPAKEVTGDRADPGTRS